jgi:hypothetical protein
LIDPAAADKDSRRLWVRYSRSLPLAPGPTELRFAVPRDLDPY